METAPGAAELTSELAAEVAESLKRIASGAGIDSLSGACHSFAEIGGNSNSFKSSSSVEENHVALRSFFSTGEDRLEDRRIALRRASPLQGFQPCRAEACVFRVNNSGDGMGRTVIGERADEDGIGC